MNLRHNNSNRIVPSFPFSIIRWVLDQHQILTNSHNEVISLSSKPVFSTLSTCLSYPLIIWRLRRLEKSRNLIKVTKCAVGKIYHLRACLRPMTSRFTRKFSRLAKLKNLGLDHKSTYNSCSPFKATLKESRRHQLLSDKIYRRRVLFTLWIVPSETLPKVFIRKINRKYLLYRGAFMLICNSKCHIPFPARQASRLVSKDILRLNAPSQT